MNSLTKTIGTMAVGISALALTLSSAGCGCNEHIDSGSIVAKIYEPGREYAKTFVIPQNPANVHLRPMIDDADHILVVEKDVNGKPKTAKVYVSEDVFNSSRIGDSFDASTPHEHSDADYEKR